VEVNFQQTVLNGALEDADFKVRLDHGREKTENIKTHALILAAGEKVGKQKRSRLTQP
jgi:hypothetical protein